MPLNLMKVVSGGQGRRGAGGTKTSSCKPPCHFCFSSCDYIRLLKEVKWLFFFFFFPRKLVKMPFEVFVCPPEEA